VTPHLLSLNQDIVAWSQEGKCGLKYVMQIPREDERQGHYGKRPEFSGMGKGRVKYTIAKLA
jgi:hypothetical protein